MSASTNVVATIDGLLTAGVGGVVVWAKKSLASILKDAETARNDIATVVGQVQKDVSTVAGDVTALQTLVKSINVAVPKQTASKAPASKRVAGK